MGATVCAACGSKTAAPGSCPTSTSPSSGDERHAPPHVPWLRVRGEYVLDACGPETWATWRKSGACKQVLVSRWRDDGETEISLGQGPLRPPCYSTQYTRSHRHQPKGCLPVHLDRPCCVLHLLESCHLATPRHGALAPRQHCTASSVTNCHFV
jgi:hypothetical protein